MSEFERLLMAWYAAMSAAEALDGDHGTVAGVNAARAALDAYVAGLEAEVARLRDVARRLVEIDERTTEGGYRYIEDPRFYSDLRAGAAAARAAIEGGGR
jgi:hypothetical protein